MNDRHVRAGIEQPPRNLRDDSESGKHARSRGGSRRAGAKNHEYIAQPQQELVPRCTIDRWRNQREPFPFGVVPERDELTLKTLNHPRLAGSGRHNAKRIFEVLNALSLLDFVAEQERRNDLEAVENSNQI